MKKTKVENEFITKEQKSRVTDEIREYLEKNFDMDIGRLQSEMFLEHIEKFMGPIYYNHGVADSMDLMNDKTQDLYLLMKDEEK
jgi:uncharacterized protein (DUF2164 family)